MIAQLSKRNSMLSFKMSSRNLFPIESKQPVGNSCNNQQTSGNTQEDIGIIKQLLIII
jgi:hypothetical protein